MAQVQQAATITVLVGKAFMLNESGDKVALKQGDMLPPGSVIMTEAGSSLVAMGDDFRLQLNENSLTEIPREQLELASAPLVLSNAENDVAAMQAAILQGQDPTQAFEAAAAGLTQNISSSIGSLNGSGNGGFVQIFRTGDSRIAEAGFDTGVAQDTFENEQPEQGAEGGGTVPRNAVITLSTSDTVAEGGLITVFANVDIASETELQITLNNGQVIIIQAGETTGSVTFESRPDDAYAQGDETLNLGISNVQGGNYDTLDTSSTTQTTQQDDADVTTVILTAPEQVTEGEAITITATVDRAPATDLILTLSNGETITIAAGESAGSVSVASRPDDGFNQSDGTVAVSITGSTGGNFESLNTRSTASTQVVDDADVTTVTLTAPEQVTEGEAITITATVDRAPATDLILTLSNGETITIAAGESAGSVSVASRPDDGFNQSDGTVAVSITGSTGGNFESLNTSSTASTQVVDDTDTTTLTFDNITVNEGSGTATVTGTLSQPAGTAFTVTLSNQATLSFAAGATEAVSTPFAIQGDDVYQDGETITVSVTDAGAHDFESLDISDSATVTVADTVDTTTLTFDNITVNEGSGTATVTGTLSQPAGTAFTVTLSNQATLFFAAGATEAVSTPFAIQGDDVYQDGETITVSVSDAGAHNFEQLDISDSATVTVQDTPDHTTLTLGDITVAEGSRSATLIGTLSQPAGQAFTVTLSNGATLSFAAGATAATSSEFAIQGDDVYQDGETITVSVTDQGDHDFEQLVSNSATVTVQDTPDHTTLTLGDITVAEGSGTATLIGTLSQPAGSAFTVTLSNGATLSFAAGATAATSSEFAIQGDDVYVDGEQLTVTVTDQGDHDFEQLVSNSATVIVQDTPDHTTLTLGDITAAEGSGTATLTGTLSQPAGSAFTVTLSNQATLFFAAGATEAVSTPFAIQGDDVYQDGE
ncbi:retention module-containing protein, partial [Oceanisphaera sediminis]|uniref:retention module-containing protein n=1 Tax=Oceanisphaera sediminis TaxID=981381 RepID=UPI0031E757A8